MDGLSFLFIAGIVLFVLFGPWILLWRNSSSRKRDRDADREQWRELTSRIYALEEKVQALQKHRATPSEEQIKPTVSEQPIVSFQAPTSSAPSVITAASRDTAPELSPSAQAAINWVKKGTVEAETAPSPAATPSCPSSKLRALIKSTTCNPAGQRLFR